MSQASTVPGHQGNWRPREIARSRIPKRIADHQVLRFIAEGSYGDVWLGRSELTGQYHAIKIISNDSARAGTAFRRELEALRRFEPISRSHRGFLQILHAGELDGGLFYVMELADDLRQGQLINPETYKPRVLPRTRLPAEECLDIGIELVETLAVLHKHGLVHRDIKPSNIVFVGGKPKLADAGLVAGVDASRSYVGTEGYVPPEGPYGFQADIFSLGKALYEICTGRDRQDFPTIPEEAAKDELVLELNEIILRACHYNPKNRYRTAESFAAELRQVKAGRSIHRVRQLERRLRLASVCGIALSLGILLCFAIYARNKAKEHQAAEERERQLGARLARATETLQRGEYAAALGEFISIAQQDRKNADDHSLRIGSLLASAVLPENRWRTQGSVAAFSGNGKRIAAAGPGLGITIHETLTGKPLKHLGVEASVLALNQDGSKLAAAQGNLVTEAALAENAVRDIPFGSPVAHLAYGAKGELVVLLANKAIILDEARQPAVELTFEGEPYRAFLSPSSRYLAIGFFDAKLILWDLEASPPMSRQFQHRKLVYAAAFRGDERVLITASFDRSAIAWDPRTGGELGFMEHRNGIHSAGWIPFLDCVATSGLDGTVRLWSDRNYQPLPENHLLRQPEPIIEMVPIPPRRLATFSEFNWVTIWNLLPQSRDPRRIPPVKWPGKRAVSLPGIELRARGSEVRGTLTSETILIECGQPIEAIAASPAGLIAVGTSDRETYQPHSVRVFDASGSLKRTFPHRDGVTFVAFSPDGKHLVSCSEDFTALIWNLETGAPAAPPLEHEDQVHWAAFNGTGNWLATASWDHTVIIWSFPEGEQLTPPLRFPEQLQHVAFFDSDTKIKAGGYNSFIKALPLHPISQIDDLAQRTNLLLSASESWMQTGSPP